MYNKVSTNMNFVEREKEIEKTSGLTLIFGLSPGRIAEGARKAAFQKG